MSSKSDSDNRSNQLNPNNDAYSSSRGGSLMNNEDDEDYFGRASLKRSFSQELNEFFRNEQLAYQPSESEAVFTFNFVSLGGQTALLKLKTAFPHKLTGYGYGSWVDGEWTRVMDCQEMAEVLLKKMTRIVKSNFETPLAYSDVRDEKGKQIIWLGYTYSPFLVSQQKDVINIEMWERTSKNLVEKLKIRLDQNEPMEREDLGIFRPEDLKTRWI